MKNIHLIGVGGTGLSAIARVLLEKGHKVSGSDQHYSEMVKAIELAGVNFFLGHKPENVAGAEVVVRSSAIPDDNVEVVEARSREIPVLKRADFIKEVMSEKFGIAVAGTHGKTSTSAMIAWMLTELNKNPSFIIGGVVSGLGINAKYGSGQYFIIEADEYDRMFLGLEPHIAVITNIEHDHPDCYPTAQEFLMAFRDFIGQISPDGTLIIYGDDPFASEMILLAEKKGCMTSTYGIENPECTFRAVDLESDPLYGGFKFIVEHNSVENQRIRLRVPGLHNVKNALAAFSLADWLSLDIPAAAKALSNFTGIGRRFEYIGESHGVVVISDYAHHPTEIKATLSAARSNYQDRRIVAVWQPHTYTRTKLLFDDFIRSFSDAHSVVITEIYPAREPVDPGYSSKLLVDAMEHPDVQYLPDLPVTIDHLLLNLKSGDVLIVLSAGDADQICSKVLAGLK